MGQGTSKSEIKKLMEKTTYSKDQINQIYTDYSCYIHNDKGLTFDEFKQFFSIRFKEYDEESLLTMFNLFDSDKNGNINFKEFACAIFIITRSPVEEKLSFLFDMFDRCPKNGVLDNSEIISIIQLAIKTGSSLGFGMKESGLFVENLLKSMERESNGGISKQEFISKASSDDKFVRMLCLYDPFGDLLY
ncbi:hypothetical protein DICPUDRAFT_43660 [Dictyostelium purpureum]|uniref:EF-hand domain-containing protein n=1 Tax=Dictyostelium purpureum TaxID=5786 RepID=F1A4J7_DICPU|nr:uncharacterized protein DICPUDRAFT_43660 [Dictyostelium purpureum]EGC28880.1 hypothetical protein DICPUDRAFT_43660 [Dictyostelium purpureum]|eukprot:XP_003294591.1 hypothetical protein DICPUDRAFT_43660 [Dictyostelium purpureum]